RNPQQSPSLSRNSQPQEAQRTSTAWKRRKSCPLPHRGQRPRAPRTTATRKEGRRLGSAAICRSRSVVERDLALGPRPKPNVGSPLEEVSTRAKENKARPILGSSGVRAKRGAEGSTAMPRVGARSPAPSREKRHGLSRERV